MDLITPTVTPVPVPTSLNALNWNDPAIQVLLNITRGLAVLVVAMIVASIAKRWVVRLSTRGRLNLTYATLLGNLVQVLVVILGIIFVLPSFGVDWTGLLTLVGAAGLAISLSLQDLLKNIIAGVYMLMEQPFRIGDRITVKDVTGTVQGIELRTTILCTDENLQVVVPNSTVLNEIVTNRSVSNLQRQIVQVVTRRDDPSEVSDRIRLALHTLPDIAPAPAPLTALEEIKDDTMRLRVEFWVTAGRRVAVAAEAAAALEAALPDATLTVV